MLPELHSQIPPDEEIASFTVDGAYDTRKCHAATAERGAHAVIPTCKDAKRWQTEMAGAVARNEALRATKHLGRALWRPLWEDFCAISFRATDGVDITAEAAHRRKRTASSCWLSASWRGTSTAKSRSSRSLLLC